MKKARFLSIFLLSLIISYQGFSQVTSIPEVAKENFEAQYPNAENVEWDNKVVAVNVSFELDGEMMNAEYSNKGIWKRTFKQWEFEKLSPAVRDGFDKSKYADRTVTEVHVVYLPGNVEQYRLKVEKNELQKRYLYFNKSGRLLRNSLTL